MPIIIKANPKSNTNSLIRDFKKVIAVTDIVQRVRDRRYFQKPSKINAIKKIQKNRLQRKIRVLKHTKNIGADVIDRMTARLNK
ncbi:MAG: 30S ribosomal protein S21 [Candidatus Pacebacteria bacterium]|nr:30S ribosomal protein S21 [Candidatus Paceibacterota bacterium]